MILGIEWYYWLIGAAGLFMFIMLIRADIIDAKQKEAWVEENFKHRKN